MHRALTLQHYRGRHKGLHNIHGQAVVRVDASESFLRTVDEEAASAQDGSNEDEAQAHLEDAHEPEVEPLYYEAPQGHSSSSSC